ncbi:MAG TPA: molecular chaperone TorD family protein [Terriglobales bacterium]|nr:molecular chaperone TorD family protein [Terriglobales bacterium]
MMNSEDPHAAKQLKDFEQAITEMSLTRLQEIYTKHFDLHPDCTLNTSYHLFGDDWRRSMFLAELKGIYDANAFQQGNELPDHLCLILRFIALKGRIAEMDDLVHECVIPAVRHMIAVTADDNPYRNALDALLIWLSDLSGSSASSAGQEQAASAVSGEEAAK